MHLLMLFGIFVVLGVLIFGKNPIREFQKEQKILMQKYGSDELTAVTNLYIEQKTQGGIFGGGGGNPLEAPKESDIKASIQAAGASSVNEGDAAPSGSPVTVARPDDLLYEGDGSGNVEVSRQADPQSPQSPSAKVAERKQEKTSNYYPPIVSDEVADPEKAAVPEDKTPLIALTGKEPRLRSGQVVAFDGTSVYSVDSSGRRKILPDGDYNLQDGSYVTVRGGHSILKD